MSVEQGPKDTVTTSAMTDKQTVSSYILKQHALPAALIERGDIVRQGLLQEEQLTTDLSTL